MVIVKCVLSVIANPVALTLATVLNARKVSVVPSWSQLGGPFKPAHCWPLGGCGLWRWVGCCKGVVEPVADCSGAESDE